MAANKTLDWCKKATLQLINQYSIAGAQVPTSYNNTMDYLIRMVPLIHDAQTYIATSAKKIPAQFKFTNNPIPNLIANEREATMMLLHSGEDIIFVAPKPARAFYFEVDGVADVHIEQMTPTGWEVVKLVITDESAGFDAYKDLLTCTNTTRIRFSGGYAYNIKNVCLYECDFYSAEKVPDYAPWVRHQMPEDFFELSGSGIPKFNVRGEFINTNEYKWLGEDLLLERGKVGEYMVEYYRYPRSIDEKSPDSTALDNAPEVQVAIPYYVASKLLYQDNPYVGQLLYNEFELKLSRMSEAPKTDVGVIEDRYDMNGWEVY